MLLKQVYHLEKCNLLKTKRNGRFTRMTIGREIILKLTFMRRRLKFNWVWKGCSFHKNNYFTSPYLSLLKNLHTVGFFSKAPANSRFARKSPGTEYFYIRVCETPGVGLFYFSWRVGGGGIYGCLRSLPSSLFCNTQYIYFWIKLNFYEYPPYCL